MYITYGGKTDLCSQRLHSILSDLILLCLKVIVCSVTYPAPKEKHYKIYFSVIKLLAMLTFIVYAHDA